MCKDRVAHAPACSAMQTALCRGCPFKSAARTHSQLDLIYQPCIACSPAQVCRVRNSEQLRESFVCDQSTRYKPRMAWYNPNDGMVPSGWLTEGLLADMAYYRPFGGTRKAEQAW